MKTIFINEHNLAYYQTQATSKIIALGFFDGLHAGHRKVILEAKKLSKKHCKQLAVMSFTPHPKVVLSDGQIKVPRLMNQSQKQNELEKLGVDVFYLVDFTKSFASLTPQQFVENYLLKLGVDHVVAGFDFTYGHKGIGNLDRMEQDAEGLLDVTKVKKVEFAGEKISSTGIRDRIAEGDVSMMPYLLGHYFETTASWNGCEFVLAADCLIPGDGSYITILKHGKRRLKTEVVVKDGRIFCSYKIPPAFIGEVILEWNKQVHAVEFIYST